MSDRFIRFDRAFGEARKQGAEITEIDELLIQKGAISPKPGHPLFDAMVRHGLLDPVPEPSSDILEELRIEMRLHDTWVKGHGNPEESPHSARIEKLRKKYKKAKKRER